ncbi:hypothetical protein CF326_g1979 [Tilletia indica]|nr:hypothetical protein CF326_g1979 [Tilletia indica]
MAPGEGQQGKGGQPGKGRAGQLSGRQETAGGATNRKLKAIPVSEASHSINSLAQSAAFFDVLRAVTRSTGAESSGPPKKKVKVGSSKDLSSLAHKSVTSLDTSLKQAFCQSCGTVLLPGLTSRIRSRSSGPHQRTISTTCTTCLERRKIAAPPQDGQNNSGLAEARRERKKRRRERVQEERVKGKEAASRGEG